jgi:PAS domain S-box-containing protein
MDWQTGASVLSILAGSLALGLAFMSWQYRALRGAKPLMGMALAVALWALLYTLELQAGADYDRLIVWRRMKYLGMSFVEFFALLFAIEYSGRAISGRVISALVVVPTLTIFAAFMNPYDLFWSSATLRYQENLAYLYIEWNVARYAHALYQLGAMLVAAWILLRTEGERGQAFLGAFALLAPLVVQFLFAGAGFFVDFSPIAYAVALALLVFGVVQLGVFDVLPDAYSTVINNNPDGVLVLDNRDRVLMMNPTFSRAVRVTLQQVIGRRAQEAFPQAALLRDTLGDLHDGMVEVDYRARRVEVRVIPLYTNQRLQGRAFLFRDITERAQAQAELAQRAEELRQLYEQVSQLEQYKTDMIRMAAHDLRHPISVTLGYLELLQDRDAGFTAVQTRYLDAIRTATQRANQMLSDILSLERIEQQAQTGIRDRFNFHRMLGEIIAQYREQALSKGLQVVVDVDESEEPFELVGDSAQVTEAISNLLNNAIKYTPSGGKVFVRLRADMHELHFEVQDTGYGIPQDQQEHLFRPFYRAKMSETATIEGTGLGLHLVKNIVERHGGNVVFYSELQKGSLFGFRLPLAQTLSH